MKTRTRRIRRSLAFGVNLVCFVVVLGVAAWDWSARAFAEPGPGPDRAPH